MKYFILILFLIFLPQIYYLYRKKTYLDLKNGSRFFIKEESMINDNRCKVILTNSDGFDIYANRFDVENPKAVVQIVHGMLEHSLNYLHFIKFLNDRGYAVIISDNRGHGKSISENHPSGFIKEKDELVDDQFVINKYSSRIPPLVKIYSNSNFTFLSSLIYFFTISHACCKRLFNK